MKKYKLNTNNKFNAPTTKSMEEQKNFGKLFHEYEGFTKRPKKPIYKNPKYFIALVVIVVLAYVVSEVVNKNENKKEHTEQGK